MTVPISEIPKPDGQSPAAAASGGRVTRRQFLTLGAEAAVAALAGGCITVNVNPQAPASPAKAPEVPVSPTLAPTAAPAKASDAAPPAAPAKETAKSNELEVISKP